MGATALMSVSVFAPASIGNLSVGFDILGLAVKPIDGTLLGDVVSVEAATEDSLVVIGEFANKLPGAPTDNIVWHSLLLFNKAMEKAGHKVEPVKMVLDKKMPVGSGLGSSACSVVAALEGLNAYYQKAHNLSEAYFCKKTMLFMMGQMEAQISGSLHYDNVAPCYLGNLQLMVPNEQVICKALPGFEECYYVMAYPGIEVSTKAAREVLPTSYSRKDAIEFAQNLATFVDACHRNDKLEAFAVVKDVIAEPYREHLLPKFSDAKEHLIAQGALAAGISGSGPTLFSVFESKELAQEMAKWLKVNYLQTDLGFVHVCKVDDVGACVL
ncbi:homoserine kinase [Pseudocolwellia sp. HL-MZ19]|uniref:homoserine kinase n=1 Tax=unclassified Pseudocolwellia TaxID=2848178 RepID=UPI003CF1ACFA